MRNLEDVHGLAKPGYDHEAQEMDYYIYYFYPVTLTNGISLCSVKIMDWIDACYWMIRKLFNPESGVKIWYR